MSDVPPAEPESLPDLPVVPTRTWLQYTGRYDGLELSATDAPDIDPDLVQPYVGHAQPHRRKLCGAKVKHHGQPCRLGAGHGTDHYGWGNCLYHGGNKPWGIRDAARQEAHYLVNELAATYGTPRNIDPHAALLEEVARTAGHIDWLSWRIGQLDGDDVLGSTLLKEYQRERKHFINTAKIAVQCGVEERQVRVAEAQAFQLAAVIRMALEANGVDPSLPEVAETIRSSMRELSNPVDVGATAVRPLPGR